MIEIQRTENTQRKSTRTAVMQLSVLLLLVMSLPLAVFLSQQRATTQQHAATTTQAGAITTPLRVSPTNSHYFVDGNGNPVLLSGSHTWDDFQDTDQSSFPAPFDFTTYVNFLKSHGQNMTILWHKDLPTYCNWGAGGTWHMSPFPWPRTGPGTATDGQPQFDLSQFNQAYFDRLRSRVIQLEQNNIYATVQLFDGLGLLNNRCSSDGYPFSAGNNVNGIADGGGTGSMTMTSANAITAIQDAYVKKVIDTVGDQPNVLWEISEEAPSNSTWWEDHMISLIHTYEAGKPFQHPVGYPWLTGGSDQTLYASAADWVAPGAKFSPSNNQGKVVINDSDHSYYGMWNDSTQTNRNYIWENFTNGSSVIFMDPYEIYWSSGNRNLCQNPVNGVCNAVDHRWDNFRDNLGYTIRYANKMNLLAMTPQGSRSSTGYALANTAAVGSEYFVYQPNSGSFTVNLANTTSTLSVEWFNPATGITTAAGTIAGGSSSQSFTPPFSGDAVLYLADTGTITTPTPTTVQPTPTLTIKPTNTPTSTPTPVPPTATPKPTITSVPTLTNTPIPNNTPLTFPSVLLHGIGKAGDSVNPGGSGNMNPLDQTRSLTVTILNGQNQVVTTKTGSITYQSTTGNFTGSVDLGTSIASGTYLIKVSVPLYLSLQLPGFYTITKGQSLSLPQFSLVVGDANGDNQLNLLDYTLLLGCYSDLLPPTNCNSTTKTETDFTDDGNVNQFDLNLFLRELSVRTGQ